MKNPLIIPVIALLTSVFPFGSALPWGSSFSSGSFSTISATSGSGGGGASSWSSPASYGWEAGDGGSWSRSTGVQSTETISFSSALNAVNTAGFTDIRGSFSTTTAYTSRTFDWGLIGDTSRVSGTVTFADVTVTTPEVYSGTVTTKEFVDTTTKETTTTSTAQVMTPTGSGTADTGTGGKQIVKLGKDTAIPEKSSTVFQDKLDSLLNTGGEKFMVFGEEGEPVKASELSDSLEKVDFAKKMEEAASSSERPVQLSMGPVQGMSLDTYTLTEEEVVETKTEVVDSTLRTEETVAYDGYIPSSTFTFRTLSGVTFEVEEVEQEPEEVVIQPEETPVPSTPETPSSSGSSGHSSSGTKPIKVTVTDNEGRTRETYSLDESEVKKNSDGSISVSPDDLPSVGNVEVVDTNTGESYSVLAGTPEARAEWTDDYSESLGGKSGGNGNEASDSQTSGDSSSGASGTDSGGSGSVSSGSSGGGWKSFSTGDDEKDRKLAVGKYAK